MTREDAIREVHANVDGDVTKVMEIINDIFDYPEKITTEELVDELVNLYDNGLGVNAIHSLVRSMYLADNYLAKHIERELMYWSNNGEDSKT